MNPFKKFLAYSLLAAGLGTGALFGEQSNGCVQNYLGGMIQEMQTGKNKYNSLADQQVKKQLQKFNFPNLEEKINSFYNQQKKGDITIISKDNKKIREVKNLYQPVSFEEISPYFIWSLISAEDRRFYEHAAWDLLAMPSVLHTNLKSRLNGQRKFRGGSDLEITAASILLGSDHLELIGHPQGLRYKTGEWLYATLMEKSLSKKEILTLFSNIANFGYSKENRQEIIGVRAAAQHYFGKEPLKLDLTESIILASIINKPTAFGTEVYNNITYHNTKKQNFFELMERAKYVLEGLRLLDKSRGNILSEEEYYTALKKINQGQIEFYQSRVEETDRINAFEFSQEVLKRIGALQKAGKLEPQASLTVYTTLDTNLQEYARQVFRENLEKIRQDFAKYGPAEELNGAVIVLDTENQGILAMVGGMGLEEKDFLNRATEKYTSFGSAFKPFLYAAALLKGVTLEDTILDAPETFYLPNQPLYTPKNFDKKYSGQEIPLYQALVQSNNIIAVKLGYYLLENFGEAVLKDFVNKLGFNFKEYHLSSSVGTDIIDLKTLSGAYSIFANGGAAHRYETRDINTNFINSVIINSTKTEGASYQLNKTTEQVIPDSQAYAEMNRALEGVIKEGTGQAAGIEGYAIRGKTGTGRYSLSCAAYEPNIKRLVMGMFAVDHPKKTGPLNKEFSGGKYAAPVVKRIMEYLIKNDHTLSFYPIPEAKPAVYADINHPE